MINIAQIFTFIIFTIIVFFITTFFSILLNDVFEKNIYFNKYIETLIYWLILILYIYLMKETFSSIDKYLFANNNGYDEHESVINILIVFNVMIPIIIPHLTKFIDNINKINKDIKSFIN